MSRLHWEFTLVCVKSKDPSLWKLHGCSCFPQWRRGGTDCLFQFSRCFAGALWPGLGLSDVLVKDFESWGFKTRLREDKNYSVTTHGIDKSFWILLGLLETVYHMIVLCISALVYGFWFPHTPVSFLSALIFLEYISFMCKLARYSFCFSQIQTPLT